MTMGGEIPLRVSKLHFASHTNLSSLDFDSLNLNLEGGTLTSLMITAN